MTHSADTGLEMRGDYIEINGPRSERDVLAVLSTFISTIERRNNCPPMLTFHDGHTIMFIDFDPDVDPAATLAIGNLNNDDDARARATAQIYHAITQSRQWRLTVSTDSTNVAESGPEVYRRAS
jgi:hypothetical protein